MNSSWQSVAMDDAPYNALLKPYKWSLAHRNTLRKRSRNTTILLHLLVVKNKNRKITEKLKIQ